MGIQLILITAITACMIALTAIAFCIRRIKGIQRAADSLAEFRDYVEKARRRITSIQRVATAQGGSTDSGGVFALYDLQSAIEFADQVIGTAETLIEARTSNSLRAACELFDESTECESGSERLAPMGVSRHSMDRFDSSAWKRQVECLLERAETSILGGGSHTGAAKRSVEAQRAAA